MLSLATSSPWAWRQQVLTACDLHCGGDISVFSEKARAWAEEQREILPAADFVSTYLTSVELARKKPEENPMIPHHWRRYAAHLLGLQLSPDIMPRTTPSNAVKQFSTASPQPPPKRERRGLMKVRWPPAHGFHASR